MKKFISVLLIIFFILSNLSIVQVSASDFNDLEQGTQIVCQGVGIEDYSVTVPAKLAPGESGTVTLTGTWSEDRVVAVYADTSVTLTNNANAAQQSVVSVRFPGIVKNGDDFTPQTFTQEITVGQITDVLFGKWRGIFHYNIDVMNSIDGVSHFGVLPEGGNYYVGIQDAAQLIGNHDGATDVYGEGDIFPAVSYGDVYTYGDYEYKYGYDVTTDDNDGHLYWEWRGQDSWGVAVRDTTKETYEVMLGHINTAAVTHAINTFCSCTNMIVAPEIPSTITTMTCAFKDCTNLKVAPVLHEGIKELDWAFERCKSLEVAPNIPYGVTTLSGAFHGCSSLTTVPEIPNTITTLHYAFVGCKSLVNAPEIPEGVTNMSYTFSSCTALVNAPNIPSTVGKMIGTFGYCTALKTVPTIPENVWDATDIFLRCRSLKTAELPCSLAKHNYTFSDSNVVISYYHTSSCQGDCGVE